MSEQETVVATAEAVAERPDTLTKEKTKKSSAKADAAKAQRAANVKAAQAKPKAEKAEPKAKIIKESDWIPKEKQAPRKVNVRLVDLVLDADTQVRKDKINKDSRDQYAEAMSEGEKFPPIEVWECPEYPGKYVLTDGFTRVAAASKCDILELAAVVYKGPYDQAYWAALGSNREQRTAGTKLTLDDYHNMIVKALTHPLFCKKSDRALHEYFGIRRHRIAEIRAELSASGVVPESGVREDKHGRQQKYAPKEPANKKKAPEGVAEGATEHDGDSAEATKPTTVRKRMTPQELHESCAISKRLNKPSQAATKARHLGQCAFHDETEDERERLKKKAKVLVNRPGNASLSNNPGFEAIALALAIHPRQAKDCLQCDNTGLFEAKKCRDCGGFGYTCVPTRAEIMKAFD